MLFSKLEIPGPVLITTRKLGDNRGYFSEKFRLDLFRQYVGSFDFVQENESLSASAGTVRGLHFQSQPHAQGKLVSCIRGAVTDIAVDIRTGSPSYGRHVRVELSETNEHQLWIPPGFAHGFCTLAENCVLSYKVTNYYSREHDKGLLWNDPELGIDWPISVEDVVLSEKDMAQPRLRELEAFFQFAE
ncbi:dTDP-4-dehydrorhamnose 3,5-epimerase [Agrobacterium larrymoorei]|uniref:dTDP-4-dehydrorhamnose 3,5-epimerase n=1 Tax=Agrobacterium larrymoorei TaxID=160699 RepID=A0AAF0HCM9_9HYPH|nr:dTDP-4-dehydrorhamnose 3,5-epimerase [Agrobacterium larrymoorei]WHA42035.1 dTDP-4-dehydrorhamnose 3,5-epimerase [Agrobacterium larrymoorei]